MNMVLILQLPCFPQKTYHRKIKTDYGLRKITDLCKSLCALSTTATWYEEGLLFAMPTIYIWNHFAMLRKCLTNTASICFSLIYSAQSLSLVMTLLVRQKFNYFVIFQEFKYTLLQPNHLA